MAGKQEGITAAEGQETEDAADAVKAEDGAEEDEALESSTLQGRLVVEQLMLRRGTPSRTISPGAREHGYGRGVTTIDWSFKSVLFSRRSQRAFPRPPGEPWLIERLPLRQAQETLAQKPL